MARKPLQHLKKEVHIFLAQIALEPHILPELSTGCLLMRLNNLGLVLGLKMASQFPLRANDLGFRALHHEVVGHS
jgi:hypothetical protein